MQRQKRRRWRRPRGGGDRACRSSASARRLLELLRASTAACRRSCRSSTRALRATADAVSGCARACWWSGVRPGRRPQTVRLPSSAPDSRSAAEVTHCGGEGSRGRTGLSRMRRSTGPGSGGDRRCSSCVVVHDTSCVRARGGRTGSARAGASAVDAAARASYASASGEVAGRVRLRVSSERATSFTDTADAPSSWRPRSHSRTGAERTRARDSEHADDAS